MIEEEALKTLQFVSNVIELKPDKKYLLVFKGNITVDQVQSAIDILAAQDIHGIGLAIDHGDDLQVIEAPAEIASKRFEQAQQYTKAIKEIADSAFWQELGQAMTINERRAIFAKLAEHLGIAVDEWGNTDYEVKKQFSVDEAKAILEPYKKIPID